MALLFVTGSSGKLKEAAHILGIPLENKALQLPEIQGSAEEIVLDKAVRAWDLLSVPLFVEDTSLCLPALNGFPGPYIKWLVSMNKPDALPRMLSSFEDKAAVAVCLIAYIDSGEPVVFRGEVRGTIVLPRGDSGFGWDSVFLPEGQAKTFAEMTVSEKSAISHRREAFIKFRRYLDSR